MTPNIPDKLVDAAASFCMSDNEQEIVEKLLLPFLQALGFEAGDYTPQQYLKVTKLGKGVAKRSGYKPDELITLEGYHIAVIEAKKSSENVREAWREALEYAQFLNRNYADRSAVSVIVGFNGRELALGGLDTPDPDVRVLSFQQLLTNHPLLTEVIGIIGRQRLSEVASEVRLSRGTQDPSSVRSLLFSGRQVPKDEFSPLRRAFRDLLNRYFSNLDLLGDEDYSAGYSDPVQSGRRREVENVARDRAPAGVDAAKLTRSTIEDEVGDYLRVFHRANVDDHEDLRFADRFLLVLGDAGAGKSTLLEWYTRFSQDREHVCFIRYDGAKGPQEISGLYARLLEQVTSRCEEYFYKIGKPGDVDALLQEIFQPRWGKEYRELYRRSMTREQYLDDRFPILADAVRSNHAEYLTLLTMALRKRGHSVCVLLDNLDQTSLGSQVEGFRTLRPFVEQFDVFGIMALREETFRQHEHSEPFNAFHKGPVLHVPAPSAVGVIQKRLELVKSKYASSDHSVGTYQLGDIKVEITRRSAARCLEAVLDQLQSGDEDLPLIDGIAGHDMRRALDAFKAVCVSSRINEESRIAVHSGFEDFAPSIDSVLCALICGEWKYYSRESPLVANVYRLVQGEDGSSVLFTLRVLKELYGQAGESHRDGLGYVSLEQLRANLKPWLDVSIVNLRRLVFDLWPTGIWQVDTLKPASYLDFSLVRIQLPGLHMLWSLYKEPAYLDCMAFDTTIDDTDVLSAIAEAVRNDRNASTAFRAFLADKDREEMDRARKRGLPSPVSSTPLFA